MRQLLLHFEPGKDTRTRGRGLVVAAVAAGEGLACCLLFPYLSVSGTLGENVNSLLKEIMNYLLFIIVVLN